MANPPKNITVEQLVQWAFIAECAALFEPDEAPGARPGKSTCAVILERRMLGATIDQSGSGWRRHDDADAVVHAMRLLPPHTQIAIAEHARSRSRPDAALGKRPMPEPALGWRESGGRWWGRTDVVSTTTAVTRRGRKVSVAYHVVPIVWRPTARQIEKAREEWTDWRDGLANILAELRRPGVLIAHRLSRSLPPAEPWKK